MHYVAVFIMVETKSFSQLEHEEEWGQHINIDVLSNNNYCLIQSHIHLYVRYLTNVCQVLVKAIE